MRSGRASLCLSRASRRFVPPQVWLRRANVVTDCISDRAFELQFVRSSSSTRRFDWKLALRFLPPQLSYRRANVPTDCISDRVFWRSCPLLLDSNLKPHRPHFSPPRLQERMRLGLSKAWGALANCGKQGVCRSFACASGDTGGHSEYSGTYLQCRAAIADVHVSGTIDMLPNSLMPYGGVNAAEAAHLERLSTRSIKNCGQLIYDCSRFRAVVAVEALGPPQPAEALSDHSSEQEVPSRIPPVMKNKRLWPGVRRVCLQCWPQMGTQKGLWRRFCVCPHKRPGACRPLPTRAMLLAQEPARKKLRSTRLARVRRGECPRAKRRVRRCEHGRRLDRCGSCVGCEHGRIKDRCRHCKPCPHGDVARNCQICAACEHGKVRDRCSVCNGCRHGLLRPTCLYCSGCAHGRLKSACVICSGCVHGRLVGNCTSCRGCPHGRIKSFCKICNACEHGRARWTCAQCRGCVHGKLLRFCKECAPCPHGSSRQHCTDCAGCPHGRLPSSCKTCSGCPHGRVRRFCVQCNPCPHGKRKQACKDCSACPHGQIAYSCKQCSGCEHGKVKRFCKLCNGCEHGRLARFCSSCKQDQDVATTTATAQPG